VDFSNYDLAALKAAPGGVYDLADGLLRGIARAFDYTLGNTPCEPEIFGLIGAVGPHKTLQDNIQHVMDVLGPTAVAKTGSWMEWSGCMQATSGAFMAPGTTPLPDRIGSVVWTGGVANWQLRRRNLAERLDPTTVDEIILVTGNRLMAGNEHPLVATFIRHEDRQPTEYEFASIYVEPVLENAGFTVSVQRVDSQNGDEVCEAVFRQNSDLLGETVLTVGNAPNLIQGAGQLRAAARQVDPSFDQDGNQLFMIGDSFPVAHKGESKDTHQNPLSGIGQIVRNAAFLQKAIEAS
jgi:hypothetical protein